jgi:hypothetical protein
MWIRLLANLGLVCALTTGFVSTMEAADPVGPIEATESPPFSGLASVSPAFVQETHDAWRSLPKSVWDEIHRAGWRVRLAEYVVDAVPWLRHSVPRGWPADYTWDNTDAVHLPGSRLLILAEKRRRPSGDVVACHRVAGVLRHELGHALDMARARRYRFRSSESDFAAAYWEDVNRLTEADRQTLNYYVQSQGAGHQEAFAEAFGLLLGGGSDVTKQDEFRRGFPAVIEFVRQEIGLAPEDAIASADGSSH